MNPLDMHMAELEEALLNDSPKLKTILGEIKTKLNSDPDVVTLLTEEQIGVIVSGLGKVAGIDLAAASAPKKTSSKSMKNLTKDDF